MEIKLGGKRGDVALVSEEDYEKMSQYNWHCNNHGYVRANINGKNISLHRFIMNPKENEIKIWKEYFNMVK